ncbi:hypothetical protein BCR42DRAFT_400221 [Absidia repens]|uniref:Uncharacterized protein n=1 Tax=Absidia repens TaxID=90262 RepID=A0A1X2J0V5_9FUNG|nr:hypothetical protein BCR42DRAFT_400221 [Absidia repens]
MPYEKLRFYEDANRHPHLSQINTLVKDVKEALKETVKSAGISHDPHEKRPQDGKTNPME